LYKDSPWERLSSRDDHYYLKLTEDTGQGMAELLFTLPAERATVPAGVAHWLKMHPVGTVADYRLRRAAQPNLCI
jgi:hypothetical protein